MDEELRVERIDGVPYIWGTVEHERAINHAIERTSAQLRSSPLGSRFDANQVAFLARDLVYVSRDVQAVLYDRLQAGEFIPIKSEIPRGAQSWVYRQNDFRGTADISGSLSTDDAPNADVATEEFQHPTTHVTASYQYTVDELEAAAFAGVPLDRDKANAAAEIIARGLDKLMRVGDSVQGITGFFNNPNVPVVTLTNGEWLTATADEIIADLQQLEQAVITNSRDNHRASRLLLPTAYEGRVAELARNTNTDSTVKTWFLKNARMMKEIERWIALDSATGDDIGASDAPQGIFYEPDPSIVFAEIPVPYEELPPQARNFGWVVPCRAKFAGVVFKRPKACAYAENLD